jgi:hypothetical protein
MKQGMILKPDSLYFRLFFALNYRVVRSFSFSNIRNEFTTEDIKYYNTKIYTNIFIEEDDIE